MAVTAQNYQPDAALAELVEHPRNPRRGREDVVAESIDVNGWYGAIIAHRATGYVLAGHTRRRALMATGAQTGPVLWLECDDETATRILLADNQAAALAAWDDRALAELLDELSPTPTELAGTGFAPVALAQLAADLALPPPTPAPVDRNAELAQRAETYQTTDVRQIVLVFQREEYERVVDALEALRTAAGAPSYAAVVTGLVLAAVSQPAVASQPAAA